MPSYCIIHGKEIRDLNTGLCPECRPVSLEQGSSEELQEKLANLTAAFNMMNDSFNEVNGKLEQANKKVAELEARLEGAGQECLTTTAGTAVADDDAELGLDDAAADPAAPKKGGKKGGGK